MHRRFFQKAICNVSFIALFLFSLSAFAQQPGSTTQQSPSAGAPSANSPSQGAPPSSSTAAPSSNTNSVGQPPPNAATPLTTGAQTQQAVQPTSRTQQQTQATGQQQQSAPGQPPQPAGTDAQQQQSAQPSANSQTNAPGALINAPANPNAPGRESAPTPAPNVLPNVPQIAPNYRARPTPAPDFSRVGVDMMNQRPMTLREAIALALQNNKDIEVARQNVRASEFDLTAVRGAFDPRFSSTDYYERDVTPSSSILNAGVNGATTQAGFYSTSRIEGLLPKGGGGYRLDFSSNRVTTDNLLASLNPQYPTSLTLNFTQPLLRGFRFDQNRRQIEIAKKNLNLTDSQFRQRAVETITNVQRAYWDLVFSLRNLQIQRDAVVDARRQLEHNKRLVAEGSLAPIDVVAAEAQISGFEQSVYTALEDVERAENNLKNLIAENRNAPLWSQSIVPTDDVSVQPPAASLDEAMSAALQNRQELQQSDLQRQINEIDQKFFREQTKPQVDLTASYGVQGLAGTFNPTSTTIFSASSQATFNRVNELSQLNGLPPLPATPVQTLNPNLIGGYVQSVENLIANRYPTFRAGVQISIPLRNRTAEAQLGRSLVDAARIRVQREQIEQNVQIDVRNSLQAIRTAQSRLIAASAARAASEQQYESEQRKLDAGQSTVFLVLERQTALTTARGNELRAQTELNKAIADLQRATGNALEANHVEISAR